MKNALDRSKSYLLGQKIGGAGGRGGVCYKLYIRTFFLLLSTNSWHSIIKIVTIFELFVKLLKEGTKTPSLAEQGTKPENGHEKNTKGLNGVPNSILDKNSGSNEFGPQFVPIDTIFCAQKLHLHESFTLLILSSS
jgi:hypothetical protein